MRGAPCDSSFSLRLGWERQQELTHSSKGEWRFSRVFGPLGELHADGSQGEWSRTIGPPHVRDFHTWGRPCFGDIRGINSVRVPAASTPSGILVLGGLPSVGLLSPPRFLLLLLTLLLLSHYKSPSPVAERTRPKTSLAKREKRERKIQKKGREEANRYRGRRHMPVPAKPLFPRFLLPFYLPPLVSRLSIRVCVCGGGEKEKKR